MEIIESTGDVQFLPIGGEPLEGCECHGPFHEKGCPGVRAEFERCLARKREHSRRFSRAMATAFVLGDFSELDERRLKQCR